ncbi:MAG TPA: YhcH/YjgK/YiaL family protein [Pirellulales bacterium]|jgi:YhcH/YjgK/YiaL family protein|nr:YhcH/YjgK/YiaL family protein [Pirellulales bacterium]
MILDLLTSANRYCALHPGFGPAFDFIAHNDLAALPIGRHAIDGERLSVGINDEQGRGHEGARLEAHRRYIDIQLALAGDDVIGWRPLAACVNAPAGYASERDVILFDERPESWFRLSSGAFTILFPGDAHAPLAGSGPVRKAVFKVAVEWNF